MKALAMSISKKNEQGVMRILYFNGLGYGKTHKRERLAMRYLKKRGVEVIHAPTDWYSSESFEDLLTRMLVLTKQQLKEHGTLVLVGSSAGGSLVVNIMGELHNPNLFGVTLCSRLHEAPLKWWDIRNLTRMAHIGTRNFSQAFFDSVTYCSKTTIPKLTANDKKHLVITQQWADFVVPRQTMSIPGARTYKVPGLGHSWGIAMATKRLPKIMKGFDLV